MKRLFTQKERKTILKNFASLTTLQGISYFLPMLILPYLIRTIGPEKFGLIAFAQAFVQYFMIATDYGFSLTATREIAMYKWGKGRVHSIFSSVLTVKLILAGISFLALFVILDFVPKFKQDWLVYILSFGTVIGNTLFPVWFFQGKEKMAYITNINVVGGICYAISIFLLVRSPNDYLWVPALTSIFSLVTGIYGLFIAFRKFELKFVAQTYEDIQKQLRAGRNVFFSIVAINAYTSTRVFIVGLLTNNTITGFYSIAERIAGFIQTFPLDSFSQAMYPRLNAIYRRDPNRAWALMRKVQRSTTIASAVALVAAFAAAPFIVRIVCGAYYAYVILTLRLLLVGVFFVVANAFRVQFLLVCGRADIYSKIHIIAALFGLPSLLVCIHCCSYAGAAVSKIIIEAGILAATILAVRRIFAQATLPVSTDFLQ